MVKHMQWFMLGLSLLVCFGAAAIGGEFTGTSITDWYSTLNKPAINPPNWIFGPVWSILYCCMAVAAWLVWKKTGFNNAALIFFAVQLILNVAWSGIFFGLRQPGWAFLEIIFLWVAIGLTTISFIRIESWAGYLFIPYLLWVSFAAYLNFLLWKLNS
jgi:benzodiazapine receptor